MLPTVNEQMTLFDYDALDAETRSVVQQRTGEIRTLVRRAAQDIIDIGQKLIEVKERLGHGRFGAWLEAEFDWTQETARRFMNVALRFRDIPQIVEFAPSALYLLAESSTPEVARQEAIERAEAGEAITYTAAREIVSEHKAAVDTDAPVLLDGDTGNIFLTDWDERDALLQAIAEEEDDEPGEIEDIETAQDEPPAPLPMAVHYSSESTSWNTPRHIVDLVVDTLGEIDLDPCSNSHDAPNVPAHDYYTEADDGLAQPWLGRVYMNPPYGDEIGKWVARLVSNYESGLVTEAVALVPARPETQWFRALWAHTLCFVYGRLRFSDAENTAPFPSVAVYLGPTPGRFIEQFQAVGAVVRRIIQ
jgi:hypothetical protein